MQQQTQQQQQQQASDNASERSAVIGVQDRVVELEGQMANITILLEQLNQRLPTVGTGGATRSGGNGRDDAVDSGDPRGRLGFAANRSSGVG